MTKQEYLKVLKESLAAYPKDFQDDMLDAFEGHFQEGFAQGKTEEEIMDDLGSIENVMENISVLYDQPKQQHSVDDDLRESVNQLKNSLKDTIRFATDSVRNHMDDSEWYEENNDEVLDVPDQEEIKSLIIKGVEGHVDVTLSPAENLSFQFHSTSSVFSQYQSTLDAKRDGDTYQFLVTRGSGKLRIYVPERITSLGVKLSAGDFTMKDLHMNILHTEQVSGDFDLSNATIHTADIHTTSGDIEIGNATLMEGTIQSVSGDIELGRIEGRVGVKTVSGDIDLAHQGNQSFTTESISGDIDIVSDDVVNNISAISVSGDIDAKIRNTDYTASVTVQSGDFDNNTHLATQQISKHEWMVGTGSTQVILRTRSGDIDLR